MDKITIEHPTDRPNFTIVTLGELKLGFSYKTIVGIQRNSGEFWIVTENCWGPTTGKHLNYLDNGDKKGRMDPIAFDTLVDQVLAKHGLTVKEVAA